MTFSRWSRPPRHRPRRSRADCDSSAWPTSGSSFDLHHPAARQPALGTEVDRSLTLEDLERLRPEAQPQNVSFPRQQVVADPEPRHRREMVPDDPVGDEGADRRVVVAAVLEVVQRRLPDRQPATCPARTTRSPSRTDPSSRGRSAWSPPAAESLRALLLEMPEADDDVGDLDAGIVDVVLDLDRASAEPDQPHERVAERGVSQVPDVGRFVGVDRRVLHDDFSAGPGARGLGPAAQATLRSNRGRSRNTLR